MTKLVAPLTESDLEDINLHMQLQSMKRYTNMREVQLIKFKSPFPV
jgi:hypothetical protein